MKWNAALYDAKHDFVAAYGRGLLEWIPRNPAQTILDVGCGTGTLTARLLPLGSRVVGVDSSPDMIARARAQFPNIAFFVCDALRLPFEGEWDVAFSNAVFHWIDDHDALLASIRRALKPGGLLVCEFGASGNIAAIDGAFRQACRRLGYDPAPRFHFPTPEAFGQSLRQNGFCAVSVCAYDRPTPLKDGASGLSSWMRQFFAAELAAMPADAQAAVLRAAEDAARDRLWNGETWVADYRRLRAIAHT